MRILVAPTAFKGSFSPLVVARAIAEGIAGFSDQYNKKIYVNLLPLADGGDGTVEALALPCKGTVHELAVVGSLDEERTAEWLELKDSAVIELASACGIAGIEKSKLSPLKAHTRGLGMVIRHVIETTNLNEIIVALGGSASTDGGSGALYELGAKFYDRNNEEIVPTGGGSLEQLSSCDLSAARQLTKSRNILIATDVENPLLGKNGAAAIFGPQKGARDSALKTLEHGLSIFADIIESTENTEILRNAKGAGAAGGTAFGLAAALAAPIVSGFSCLSTLLNLPEKIRQSDLVISGEGHIDNSSLQGKVIGSLYKLCQQNEKPLWLIAGSVSKNLQISNLKAELIAGLSMPDSDQLASLSDIRQFVFDSLCKKYKL